ncbi:MAG: nuclear transport factor 2 family protein [Spongiibacteraceae bacterium]
MALSIEEISDRIEINDLLNAYCDAVDTIDIDAFNDIFTPDAKIDYSAFGFPVVSFEETKAFLKDALPKVPGRQHMIANSIVRITGNTATGKTLCFNPMTVPQEDGSLTMTHFGLWYIDKFIRTAQGWRICERSEEKSYAFALQGELS